MKRFLGIWLFFLILGGMLIYFQKDEGCLSFLGQIPGDIVIRREGRILYLPAVSSFAIAVIISFFLSLFREKRRRD